VSHDSYTFNPEDAERIAADWLARRDRGLTAAEQDDYLNWLGRDARHAALMARHEDTMRRMKRIAQWRPAYSSEPDINLFAPPRSRLRRWLPTLAAAAVLLVVGGLVWRGQTRSAPKVTASKIFLRVNEKRALSDGSLVELRDGSRIEVAFTDAERRVRLTGGEAHFVVAKNDQWPFVVEAAGVAVRAVGTAFAVRVDAAQVDVLVTEGRVRVEPPSSPAQAGTESTVAPPVVAASHRAVISLATPDTPAEVTPMTQQQMDDVLSWQAPRLQFHETPLGDAVAEFNRYNSRKISVADSALNHTPIGGAFRVDNPEGFVALLELTVGVRAERNPDGDVVLRRAP
jgi:transmembrane sensor